MATMAQLPNTLSVKCVPRPAIQVRLPVLAGVDKARVRLDFYKQHSN
jgi:hypothetical protein